MASGILAVFLHSYPDGAKQSRDHFGSKNPERFFCPRPHWFEKRFEQSNDSISHDAQNSQDEFFVLRYFALVRVNAIWMNLLSFLDEEEHLGWEFLMYPTDFFSLHVLDLFELQSPTRVVESIKRKFAREPSGLVQHVRSFDPFITSCILSRPNEIFTTVNLCDVKVGKVMMHYSGQSHSDVQIQSIATVLRANNISFDQWTALSVPVVQPIYDLLTRRRWSKIPCLGRWFNLVVDMPSEIQKQIGSAGNCPPETDNAELSMATLRCLTIRIQTWSSKILHACSEDEKSDLEMQLQSTVRWLFNVMASLPKNQKSGLLRNKSMYSSLFLVRTMLSTRLIPAYVSMKTLCHDVLQLLFPNLLGPCLDDILSSKHLFPSVSSKHFIRLALDAALLLWRCSQEECLEFVRFGGADSSPQHGNNWLLSSVFLLKRKTSCAFFVAWSE